MTTLIDLYNAIEQDPQQRAEFTSNAVEQNKRVFKILNSNIKSFATYRKYLDDVLNHPEKDNHQKPSVLSNLNIYSEVDNPQIILRQEMLFDVFGQNYEIGTGIKDLFIFFLALGSNYSIREESKEVLEKMPIDSISEYNDFLNQIINRPVQLMNNPVFSYFVLYSNQNLLFEYLNSFPLNTQNLDFLESKRNEVGSMLYRRIDGAQRGAFINEALIPSHFYQINSGNFENKSYTEIIDELVTIFTKSIDKIYGESAPTNNDWLIFRNTLIEFNEEQKAELLRSVGLIENNVQENAEFIGLIDSSPSVSNGEGRDVQRSILQRQGQSRFRKMLIETTKQYGCRVKSCQIHAPEHLRASHIKSWKESSSEEKVNPNNGLLLCPAHDFLFDKYLISFSDDGKIIISDELDYVLYSSFNISTDDEIEVMEGNSEFLMVHRKKLL